jgi:voltage-gated potassium channel Kch
MNAATDPLGRHGRPGLKGGPSVWHDRAGRDDATPWIGGIAMTVAAHGSTTASAAPPQTTTHDSSMYELFIGLNTIVSLLVALMIVVVEVPEVDSILHSVDTLFCLLFVFDFVRSFRHAPSKMTYMFGERPGRSVPLGLFDLLGSIPNVGILRLLRIFRVLRIARIVRARGSRGLAREFIHRRAEAAIYIIFIASMLVLLLGSSAIAFIEPGAAGSNIESGGDAFWWAFTTITTVGYGDRFPVTTEGRFVGILTMAVGIGIFGVLTSYLSSLFLAPPKDAAAAPASGATHGGSTTASPAGVPDPVAVAAPDPVAQELAALRRELSDLRRLLESRSSDPSS